MPGSYNGKFDDSTPEYPVKEYVSDDQGGGLIGVMLGAFSGFLVGLLSGYIVF